MKSVDKVSISVIQRRLESTVGEMGEAGQCTAPSGTENAGREYSAAIFDGRGRLVALAEQAPLHLGALPFALTAIREFFEGRVKSGDVYILNDPYHGGTHPQDLTTFVPVFAQGCKEPVFWTLIRSHQSDIGSAIHGSCNPAATEIYQQGLRISPQKLYDAGELRDDVLHMIATNVRHAADFREGLQTMIESARLGEQSLQCLISEYGVGKLLDSVSEILDGSERQSQACISKWDDGVYTEESLLDDGHGSENKRLKAIVTKLGGSLHVDLTECDPQAEMNMNSSYANTVSALHRALASLIDPGTPKNDGTFRPISLTTKPKTIVHPLEPAPVARSTNRPSQGISELVVKALSVACTNAGICGNSSERVSSARAVDMKNG